MWSCGERGDVLYWIIVEWRVVGWSVVLCRGLGAEMDACIVRIRPRYS